MNYRLQTHNRAYVFITLACLLWFGAISLQGATRYVVPPGTPGVNPTSGYTTWATAATNIQTALSVTPNSGDTIWVTNGTYYLRGSELTVYNETLRSVNGMEKTFINGNYPAYTNRCIYMYYACVVTGFTIINGYMPVNNVPSYPSGGGGVLMTGGTLQNCHITTNRALTWGGGVLIWGGTVKDCIISSNSCPQVGGGMGGGLTLWGENITINRCVFMENSTLYRGGGLCVYAENNANRAANIFNCTFVSNRCSDYGGGLLINGANSIVRNCLFIGNTGGAGLCDMYQKDTKIQNCTFVRNSGGGIQGSQSPYSGELVENCIFYGSSYSTSHLVTNINNRTDSTLSFGVRSGNITNNPSFVNYAAENFRLANNSPCINTGTNASWTATGVDLDGKMRIRYGTVDMGAYERVHEATFYRFH